MRYIIQDFESSVVLHCASMASPDIPSRFPAYISDGRFAQVDAEHQSASVYVLTILGIGKCVLNVMMSVLLDC